MSQLVFDGTAHTLTLLDRHGAEIHHWPANNVVDHRATLRFVPNGTYPLLDTVRPHKHGAAKDSHHVLEDSLYGAYGSEGIIRFRDFVVHRVLHRGVGVHAGRANQGAQNHATMGCIRTTEEAMRAIVQDMAADPLTTITVKNNYDQLNVHPRLRGDHHAKHPAKAHHRGR